MQSAEVRVQNGLRVRAVVDEPLYPSSKAIMAAKSKPVDEKSAADLGFGPDQVGWAGSGQEIIDVANAPKREAGEIIEDDGEGFAKIVAYLEKMKLI